MKPYLLDTCTISDLFKGVGRTQEKLRQTSPARIAISTITIMEVLYGFELSKAAQKKFSNSFTHLCKATRHFTFDERAAESAAQIRANLKSKGTPIGSFDLLIAAIATANDCILVSSNKREFEHIGSLEIEDWR